MSSALARQARGGVLCVFRAYYCKKLRSRSVLVQLWFRQNFLSIYLPIHLSYLYISISLYLSNCVGKDASAGHQGEGEGEERALPEAEGDRQNRAIKDQREGEFQSINL